jgi:hypothetical protein
MANPSKIQLPRTDTVWRSTPLECAEREGERVEFRLVYQGPLPAASSGRGGTRRDIKHGIRKNIHQQLTKVWTQHPALSFRFEQRLSGQVDGPPIPFRIVDNWIAKYKRFGFNFLPLITEELGLACALDILFLRPDQPGMLIDSTGDIDNRIKVLFDGLRMPRYADEVEGYAPDAGEDPFFCLLEDDALINEVKITTDQMLVPAADENDVLLVIHVKSLVVKPSRQYLEFYV